jgi:tripartite ATP-independent transporter DctM subunit
MTLSITDILSISMFVTFLALLFSGFPVAWVLGGVSVLFTAISVLLVSTTTLLDDTFYAIDWNYTASIVDRSWGVMENWVLVALPMFIFMGLFLDKSNVARELMENFARLLGRVKGGLAVAIAIIGLLMAASTGIIGASVVLLTVMGVPIMLESGYDKTFAVGTVCAVGTLGILIPPSIMLVLMADRLTLPVGDLFMGAMIPGLLVGLIYIAYLLIWANLKPGAAPAALRTEALTLSDVISILKAMLPPLLLILSVLGSIFFGIATATEASGVGAAATVLLTALKGRLNWKIFKEVSIATFKTTGFIFGVIFGATAFALVFRGLGGDELIENALHALPLDPSGVVITILVITFFLGFFLDWIEITLIILPLVGPAVANLGFDLVWFAILFALTLQTSFITPPVGPAIFFAQGVTPPDITVVDIYKGVFPFVILQLIGVALVFSFPALATWLPSIVYK